MYVIDSEYGYNNNSYPTLRLIIILYNSHVSNRCDMAFITEQVLILRRRSSFKVLRSSWLNISKNINYNQLERSRSFHLKSRCHTRI